MTFLGFGLVAFLEAFLVMLPVVGSSTSEGRSTDHFAFSPYSGHSYANTVLYFRSKCEALNPIPFYGALVHEMMRERV